MTGKGKDVLSWGKDTPFNCKLLIFILGLLDICSRIDCVVSFAKLAACSGVGWGLSFVNLLIFSPICFV